MRERHTISGSVRAIGAAVVCLAIGTASAHHPILGKFDQNARRTLEGIVTKVDWRNPHAHIFINITEGGETVNWAVELESPSELHLSGWSRDTLAPGDAIVVGAKAVETNGEGFSIRALGLFEAPLGMVELTQGVEGGGGPGTPASVFLGINVHSLA